LDILLTIFIFIYQCVYKYILTPEDEDEDRPVDSVAKTRNSLAKTASQKKQEAIKEDSSILIKKTQTKPLLADYGGRDEVPDGEMGAEVRRSSKRKKKEKSKPASSSQDDDKFVRSRGSALSRLGSSMKSFIKATLTKGFNQKSIYSDLGDKKEGHMMLAADSTSIGFAVFLKKEFLGFDLVYRQRAEVFSNCMFLHATQFFMTCSIMVYAIGSDAFLADPPGGTEVLIARFAATVFMHIYVEKDVRNGLAMMKYSVNHRDHFVNPYAAFIQGYALF